MGASQSSVGSSNSSNGCEMFCCAKRSIEPRSLVRQQRKSADLSFKDIQSAIQNHWNSSRSMVSSGFQDYGKSKGSKQVKSSASEDIDNPSPTMSADGTRRHTGMLRGVPPPLDGWTVQEQQILIQEIDSQPHSRKSHGYLERIFARTHRLLPAKSINEIETCYAHIQSKQIAYFGVKDTEGRQVGL